MKQETENESGGKEVYFAQSVNQALRKADLSICANAYSDFAQSE